MAEGAIFNNHLGRELCARQQGIGTFTVQLSTANVSVSETVDKMHIKKIIWSGNCAITRGANTIWSGAAGTAGMVDLSGNGMANKENATANVALVVNDGGSLMVLIGKESRFTSTY